MGLFDAIFPWHKPNRAENPAVPLTTSVLLDAVPGGGSYDASPDGALRLSTVFACVRVISETIASLPIILYRRTEDGKERATDHPVYALLHDAPNEWQTPTVFMDRVLTSLLLRGNAYVYIERNQANQPVSLIQLDANTVSVGRTAGRKVYKVENVPDLIPDTEIIHIIGLPGDGLTGQSPLSYARNAIQLGLATEEFGSRFFAQGSAPSGVLEHPGQLSTEAAGRLRASWEAMHTGLAGAHKVAILEEGLKFNPISVPNNDAQFLETRKFSVAEVCRFFRVPLHMAGDLDHATFSNIEHQSIEFVTNTIRPYLVKIEQELTRKLIPAGQRGQYVVEFLLDSILRGDIKTRYEAYSIGRQQGWLSVDDIRSKENMNALPDGKGQVYLQPLNMAPAGEEKKEDQNKPKEGDQKKGTDEAN